MEVDFELNKIDVSKYQNKIDEIKNKLKDFSKPLNDFRDYYIGIINQNWYGEGKLFERGGWEKLKKKYLKQKKNWVETGKIMKNGLPAKYLQILRLTGLSRKETVKKENVKITKNEIVFTAGTKYIQYQQKNRPFLYPNEKTKGLYMRAEDQIMLSKILEKYLFLEQENAK